MRNTRCLDRESLGRRGFWREFRLASKEKERVKVLTRKTDVNALQVDLKFLLNEVAKDDPRLGALLGLSKPDKNSLPRLPMETMILVMSGAMTMVTISLIRTRYRFSVSTNPDGTIAVDAEPLSP